ncbi:hypothetical protein ACH4OW_22975 [Streptomyces sp. NPDC017056]|uniref:hypothetical protein n=1 Tax=Streptomyces sp. NPDC017056 TaxID=3364973 RepID=UPI00378DBB8E
MRENSRRRRNESFAEPKDTVTLPPNTVKDPFTGNFTDDAGNLYGKNGNLLQDAKNAPQGKPATPTADADNPRFETPAHQDQPVLAGVGGRGDDAVRGGSDVSDPVRTGDKASHGGTGPGDTSSTWRAGDGNAPGGRAANMPTSSHSPGGDGSTLHTQDAGGLDNSPNGARHTAETNAGGSGDHGHRPADGTSGSPLEQSGGSGHEAAFGSDARGDSPRGPDEPTPGDAGADQVRVNEAAHPPLGNGPRRANEPLPELTAQERADHWSHLDKVEQRSLEDFDHLQRDPDKNGGISEPSKDEARVGLDLREQARVPDDIQRPTEADRGEFYSPSTGRYYDIKGVHSDWPPFNNVRDKTQPFRGAYDPSNNGRWVKKLSEQIVDKERIVILDVRNANQAAIDDIKSIVQKNDWEDDVIWYP